MCKGQTDAPLSLIAVSPSFLKLKLRFQIFQFISINQKKNKLKVFVNFIKFKRIFSFFGILF